MTPFYADPSLTVHVGDCRAVMADMEPASVHCVVTSPPYWGLRSYGTSAQVWGGDPEHAHEWGPAIGVRETTYGGKTRWQHVENGRGEFQESRQDREGWLRSDVEQGNYCACGAWRGDLGLEPTPEQYVANIVSVFREVRRVLRPDGTVWCNLGDSYASHDPGGYREGEFLNPGGRPPVKGQARNRAGNYRPGSLKPKDLVGIPWMVAFALRAAGWYLRSDIIWSKPNPMPESVTDRPTKAHEYLFLLSKSPRYYFDAEAVRQRAESGPSDLRKMAEGRERIGGLVKEQTDPLLKASALTNIGRKRSVGGRPLERERNVGGREDGFTRMPGGEAEWAENGRAGRNLRSVWTIATQPYPGAHFATFPERLVEPCVKAGTSKRGVCPECGAPWVRETLTAYGPDRASEWAQIAANGAQTGDVGKNFRDRETTTTGWRPICEHYPRTADWPALPPRLPKEEADHYARRIAPQMRLRAELLDLWAPLGADPATILDPFAGSGTVGRVANRLGRRAIIIDLSADYIDQAMVRNAQAPLGLTT